MNDEKLVQCIKTDPEAGMKKLMDRYTGYVAAVVRARLGGVCDTSEIEDCIVDVFLAFHDQIDRFVPNASVKNYLCVLARNLAVERYRKKAPVTSLDDEALNFEIASEDNVEDDVAQKALIAEICREIDRMGEPDRSILFGKYFLGKSAEQIARERS